MTNSVLELAQKLINIESTSGHEGPMTDFLIPLLQARGWTLVTQQLAPGRSNLFAHRGRPQPRLIFNSHLDTVPPYFPAHIDGPYLRGRGACDTKSLIAAQILACDQLIAEGIDDIGLLYVVGEEVDHSGMIKANELGLNPDYLIVGEPTESRLASRQKGLVKVRIDCAGTAAHSGYPHTGESAIDPLLDLLQELRQYPWPEDDQLGATTLNIGVVQGGRAANIVPDQAYAEVMIRVVTNHEEILSQVRHIVGDRGQISLVAANDPVALTTLPGFPTQIVAFNTDIPYLQFDGKALLWGAGSILHAHTPDEKIRITDLEEAVHTYAELGKKCLGEGAEPRG